MINRTQTHASLISSAIKGINHKAALSHLSLGYCYGQNKRLEGESKLSQKVCLHVSPLWAWLQSEIPPEGICHHRTRIPCCFSLTGFTSPPHHFPPPALLPTVCEGLWGILLFPWQHAFCTLHPILFLSSSSYLSFPSTHSPHHSQVWDLL